MTIARSQFLRVFDAAGVTRHRWQSYHAWTTVSWEGASWQYQPFESSGIVAGLTGDEGAMTITMPATPTALSMVEQALALRHRIELRIYQFTATTNDLSPPADQSLVATFTGEPVGGSGSLTELRLELGSLLSPVGATIPPRTFSTRLIGAGCRL
jgi:hypothetical protein